MNGRRGGKAGESGRILFRLLSLLALLAILAGLYLFRVPLLRAAGNFWVVNDPLATADAIVILGDDNYEGERAVRAAQLYHERWAPRVVASGRYLRPYLSVAELMRRDLVERGVPAEAVVVFAHRADNTREEALALRHLVLERGWRSVLIVTSNFHTRRARFIFRRLWPSGYQFRVTASTDATYDPNSWWRSRGGMKRFFYETIGIFVAAWELSGSEAGT